MPSRIRPLSVVAALGVVVSIVMVVYGLSESTPAQQVALELSALPLSVSLAAGDVILLTTGSRQPGPRARMVVAGGAAISLLGLLLMVFAYVTGPRGMVHLGQFLVFVGLLLALLVGMGMQRGRTEWFHLQEVEDDDDPDAAVLPGMVESEQTL
ncbi:MAG: hypothetical protein J0I14_15940 [Propionibacteriaceae bacterium]|nr:hypothetical protein [Propionibacteriaceae bacterium]